MEKSNKTRTKSATGGPRKRDSKQYDVDVLTRLDRVTAPKQARSERSLNRILEALESLLETRPFHEISIPDIAASAGCGVAAIYARFRDKPSILAGLHESLRERMLQNIRERLAPDRIQGLTLDQFLEQYFTDMVRFYTTQRHLVAGAVMLGDQEVYDRIAATIRFSSEQLATALALLTGRAGDADLDRRVHLATAATYALLQQRAVFYPANPSLHSRNSDKDFVGELVRLYKMCLTAPDA